MRLRFTKMHGAGNDFVVLDATAHPIELTPDQFRALGDRRFGVGADQILLVEPSRTPGIDFRYRIFNNSGDEVEQCGNGARCFVRYVVDKGLSSKRRVRVETMNRVIELALQDDGRVTVDMGAPVFEPAEVPFDASGLTPSLVNGFELWPLQLGDAEAVPDVVQAGTPALLADLHGSSPVHVAVLSMGNPHAVQRVDDVDTAPVAQTGPQIEAHGRFPRKVNAGFMQIVSRGHIRLRVYERGAGETLSCGTGACAAVVAGIRLGWLDAKVDVDTRGGRLTIEWAGNDRVAMPAQAGSASPPWPSVFMTGPAQTVFEGEISL